MKNIKIICILVIALLLGMFFYYQNSQEYKEEVGINYGQGISIKGETAIVYKTATCGCCAIYASYLRKEGLNVEVRDVPDLNVVKEEFDIPASLSSCHTTLIGGYVIEGHIPLLAIEKLLNEKPDIKGIAMPGMPIGSPGMPGKKVAPFEIYRLGDEELFMTI